MLEVLAVLVGRELKLACSSSEISTETNELVRKVSLQPNIVSVSIGLNAYTSWSDLWNRVNCFEDSWMHDSKA